MASVAMGAGQVKDLVMSAANRARLGGQILAVIITADAFLFALCMGSAISAERWRSVAALVVIQILVSLFVSWWWGLRPAMLHRRDRRAGLKAAADAAALADCKKAARAWLDLAGPNSREGKE